MLRSCLRKLGDCTLIFLRVKFHISNFIHKRETDFRYRLYELRKANYQSVLSIHIPAFLAFFRYYIFQFQTQDKM